MDDFNLGKVFEIKPISDRNSKREFLKRKKESKKVNQEKEENIQKEGCIIKDGHIDCYA